MSKRRLRNRRRRRRMPVGMIILMVILVCVFVFSAFKVISAITSYSKADSFYKKIENVYKEETVIEQQDGTKKKVKVFSFDLDKLREVNDDAVGYIRMSCADSDDEKNIVDYPVVQGSDNNYYLNHMFDGSENNAGSIFMDCNIEDRFEAQNCIIYGHNMRSGARMFSCLNKYKDESYYKTHQTFEVYGEGGHYRYRVFAAFRIVADGNVYESSFDDVESLRDMVSESIGQTAYDTGFSPEDFDMDSKIITLSTCLDGYEYDHRFVVLMVRE